MKIKILFLFAFVFSNTAIIGQNDYVIVNPGIHIFKDSIESQKLLSSLNVFLRSADGENQDNAYVLPSQKVETFIQLDEIYGITKSEQFENKHFYKPYLMSVTQLEDDKALILVSYIGVIDQKALTRASFELIAHKSDVKYMFSSPLIWNTKDWNTLEMDKSTYYYKQPINIDNVKQFESKKAFFDKKLKIENKQIDYYCTINAVELLRLMGVMYKSDYNGRKLTSFYALLGDKTVKILGGKNAHFDSFDPHDLWHDRMSIIVSRRKVNKSIDEAYAYLYGGSWGFTWEEILEQFLSKVASDKNTNWENIKENPLNFEGTKERHLYADYVVNALIIEKMEKEQGFEVFWEFLNSSLYEKGHDKYYISLEKIMGIKKQDYNDFVWKLIRQRP